MLRYLKSLPEPVIPLSCYDRFIEAAGWPGWGDANLANEDVWDSEQTDNTIVVLQGLVGDFLPPLNRQLLLYLLDLFAVFAAKADVNLMTVERIVSCCQPSLLAKTPAEMGIEDYEKANNVIGFMINNQDHFLIGLAPGTEVENKHSNEESIEEEREIRVHERVDLTAQDPVQIHDLA